MTNRMVVTVDDTLCEGCGECIDGCPVHVFEMGEGKAVVLDTSLCGDCRYCESVCPSGAVRVDYLDDSSQ
jgi:NAD-dependent dihydropyrimidine dehydrogenase PreA subunit